MHIHALSKVDQSSAGAAQSVNRDSTFECHLRTLAVTEASRRHRPCSYCERSWTQTQAPTRQELVATLEQRYQRWRAKRAATSNTQWPRSHAGAALSAMSSEESSDFEHPVASEPRWSSYLERPVASEPRWSSDFERIYGNYRCFRVPAGHEA